MDRLLSKCIVIIFVVVSARRLRIFVVVCSILVVVIIMQRRVEAMVHANRNELLYTRQHKQQNMYLIHVYQ